MNHSLGKDSVANEFIRLNSEIHRDKVHIDILGQWFKHYSIS